MKKYCFQITAFVVILCSFNSLSAQPGSAILHSLQKLNTLGSVLYIAAHPDDENTRLLTYLANERKYRTAYLSITRGDGGQNLIGSEQGDMLGLIRTEELLAARRIDGAEQWFTRAVDFGYSKNPEETFRFWNRDLILEDVVYAIRKFRPDVIITRFPTTGEGGHGHHTASAILAIQAFEMAGDPSKFPDQVAALGVWQPKRLFWNTFNFGGTNTTGPGQLKLDVGGYNPLLGKSYGEIAALSRSCHKSQGFGSAMQRGTQYEYFKQLKGDSALTDIFEGINTEWKRIFVKEKISIAIQTCIEKFDAAAPEKSLEALAKIYRLIERIQGDKEPYNAYWKELKLAEIKNIMLACAGVWIETTAKDYSYVAGQNVEFTTQVIMRNQSAVKFKRIYTGLLINNEGDSASDVFLVKNQPLSFKTNWMAGNRTGNYSTPHWLSDWQYDNTPFGQPFNNALFEFSYLIEINGIEFMVPGEGKYKYTDPVKGEIYRPMELLPPATLNPDLKTMVLNSPEVRSMFFRVRANQDSIRGSLLIAADKACQFDIVNPDFYLKKEGDEVLIEVKVMVQDPVYEGAMHASLLIDGTTYSESIQRIEYDHIPFRLVLSPAKVKVLRFDLKTSNALIGYIPGAGDEVQICLKQLGYRVEILSNDMLKDASLSQYAAIICGVRAFNTNPELPLYHKQLMNYVSNGGRLIVQYNTNSRVGPLQSNIGPYKFTISRNRVTDENAEIKFLDDTCAILNFPNRITAADFNGWVQERGIYFATETDSTYRFVFAMHDPGEPDQNGSLIWTPYGKGVFVYTGLAFFRQLPAGVPGAYRLFVNLLSIPVK